MLLRTSVSEEPWNSRHDGDVQSPCCWVRESVKNTWGRSLRGEVQPSWNVSCPERKWCLSRASILRTQEKATNSSTPSIAISVSVKSFQIKTYLNSWCHGAWVLMRKERWLGNMPESWVLWRDCRQCCMKDYTHFIGWLKMWGVLFLLSTPNVIMTWIS